MELLWTLLLAVPTIFLAAFLAAALENVRERRRTRKWVMRFLAEFVDTGRFDSPEPIQKAFQRWLDAESPDDMDEDAWRHTWFASFSNSPELTPLLRSEAATAVPAELFTALHEFEGYMVNLKQIEIYLRDLFREEISALWFERRVPLEGADRRRVELLIRMLAKVAEMQDLMRTEPFERLRRAVRSA
jgi:hypothetical protein